MFAFEKENDIDDSCEVDERTERVDDELFGRGLVEDVPGW